MTIHGKDCFLGYQDASSAWHVFGGERSCSVSVTTDMQETSGTAGGKWKEYIPMKSGWRMQFNGLLLEDTDLTAMMMQRTKIYVRMLVGDKLRQGYAYISSINESGALHELGQVSFELTGTGPLSV